MKSPGRSTITITTDASILVVDDDPAALRLVERVLLDDGYRRVHTTTDSRSILAGSLPPDIDLMIIDLQMPEVDGLRLLAEMRRALPADEFLPMLVVTADNSVESRRRALAGGADDYLVKPIDVVELALRVKHLLALRSMHLELAATGSQLASQVEVRTEELAAAMARLESLIRAKDAFIASVSHELRTPLTAVLGFAAELADRCTEMDPAEVMEAARLIADQASDLSAIIDDLLVAARSDLGPVKVADEAVDLDREVEAVISALRAEDRSRIETMAGAAKVTGDHLRVRQIVRNLLSNALRHGGDGIIVETHSNGASGWVTVIDDGPGISEEIASHLFEPYARGGDSAANPSSIGLGLTVSRFLAHLMHGTVDLVPHTEGTAFRLTLPAGPRSSE